MKTINLGDLSFFLYKRLSRFITCTFFLGSSKKIMLRNKFEVASFRDVFCHPFYWQAFAYIKDLPKIVVDCGSHCGHFTVLCDICIENKFGDSSLVNYVLIEPNPYLIPSLKKALDHAKLTNRSKVFQSLLGKKSGSSTLWINPKNYLASGLFNSSKSKPHNVDYLDLSTIVDLNQKIDLIKVDIEGGEFDFIGLNLNIFALTQVVFMEIHSIGDKPIEKRNDLVSQLESVGLHISSNLIRDSFTELLVFTRSEK